MLRNKTALEEEQRTKTCKFVEYWTCKFEQKGINSERVLQHANPFAKPIMDIAQTKVPGCSSLYFLPLLTFSAMHIQTDHTPLFVDGG